LDFYFLGENKAWQSYQSYGTSERQPAFIFMELWTTLSTQADQSRGLIFIPGLFLIKELKNQSLIKDACISVFSCGMGK
jgi:hypothetical protein